jgi:2-keto-4-pentenoate hydratase/2-oxohepta-3-ene-1,7-dioic acid hydratase in catechol pathway
VKLANVNGRAALVVADGVADIELATAGQFGPELAPIYDDWLDFADVARNVTEATGPLVEADLGCPVSPRQVFAIGINYRAHSEESGVTSPEVPGTFTKFPTCLAGPYDDIPLVGDTNDWEVELVVVIARRAHHVQKADAWNYVAGLAVGQDISDRHLQFAAADQWSLGKSRSGYGPVGPWVVTPDEISKPDDLAIRCSLDGETMQQARTSQLIFNVPRLIVELSAITTFLPGDIVFTGTPSGVGYVRQPPRYLQPGQILESWIEGIGTLRNRCR